MHVVDVRYGYHSIGIFLSDSLAWALKDCRSKQVLRDGESRPRGLQMTLLDAMASMCSLSAIPG